VVAKAKAVHAPVAVKMKNAQCHVAPAISQARKMTRAAQKIARKTVKLLPLLQAQTARSNS
jgi:hypothetical protein